MRAIPRPGEGAAAEKRRIDGGQAGQRFGEPFLQCVEAGFALNAVFIEIEPAIDLDLQTEQTMAATAIEHGGIAAGIGRVARRRKTPADEGILGPTGQQRRRRGAITVTKNNVGHRKRGRHGMAVHHHRNAEAFAGFLRQACQGDMIRPVQP